MSVDHAARTSTKAKDLQVGDVAIILGACRTVDRVVLDDDVVLVFFADGSTQTFRPGQVVLLDPPPDGPWPRMPGILQ